MFHISPLAHQYFRIEALAPARALGYQTHDIHADTPTEALRLYHLKYPNKSQLLTSTIKSK